MLDINDITLRFGGRLLFNGASAHISDGQRVGLTGRNGTGKTTLFRLILGELTSDDGDITITKGHRIATVAQEIPDGNLSLIDCVLKADTERTELLAELEQAEQAEDGIRISEIHERLNIIGAGSAEARAGAILYGLGFSAEQQKQPLTDFSGGWRMRVALAAALFVPSDILLLDEPTNHLDLEATLWLENFLSKYAGTLVIISHDRSLLNHLCTRILHIEGLKIQSYGGNYDAFEQTRALQRENEQKQAAKTEEKRKHLQAFIDRFRYKASKAKQAQSRVKMLEKLPEKAFFYDDSALHFKFPSPQELPSPLIKIENGAVGYGEKAVLSKMTLRIDADDRIALLGANGNGKSTFAKLLAGKLKLMDGTIQASGKLKVGYYAQHQTEELSKDLTPIQQMQQVMKEANETQIRAHLGAFGLTQQKAETRIALLSGGEKARLLFAVMTRDAPHILLLDEPTNHLDIDARDALIEAINAYQGAVILITHDPHLIELTADRLWLIDAGRCTAYDGDLEDYRALLAQKAKIQAAGKGQDKSEKSVVSRKNERREAAEKRQQLAPLRKTLKETETELAKLNEQKEKIEEMLEDPSLYMIGLNAAKVKGLQISLARLNQEIDTAEERWLELSAKLETAQQA
ncbi:MAG: ABC-F family ATP-binding cassette domain-containing protein [Alphaproteobacteria bacterium]|nr:ABC-F family ATP-binding cassette domain-containing protein [Alphaproteobacteria bacterium]